MLCTQCEGAHAIDKHKVDKSFPPAYCGGCGFGFLRNPANDEASNITCKQADNYADAVEKGFIKAGESVGATVVVPVKSKKVSDRIPPTVVSPTVSVQNVQVPVKEVTPLTQQTLPVIEATAPVKTITAAVAVIPTGSPIDRVFRVISNFGPIGKADILMRASITEIEYNESIVQLRDAKLVIKTGEKRGTKYHVPK